MWGGGGGGGAGGPGGGAGLDRVHSTLNKLGALSSCCMLSNWTLKCSSSGWRENPAFFCTSTSTITCNSARVKHVSNTCRARVKLFIRAFQTKL